MPYTTAAKGYIKLVRDDGTLVSQHSVEREALERLSQQPAGKYTIRYPDVSCVVLGAAVPIVVPPLQLGQLGGTVRLVSYGGGVPGRVSQTQNLNGTAAQAIGATLQSFPAAAVIALYDVNMNLVGYGPSFWTGGPFYGRVDLLNGDRWGMDIYPGITFTYPEGGGLFQASGPAGTYSFPWKLYHAATGVIESGIKTGVVLS